MHNTDELYTYLKGEGYRGLKRVDNYIKQVFIPEQKFLHPGPDDYKPTPEDVEIFEIERQRRQEELENFRTVERIVSARQKEDGSGTLEYFCKWSTLPYSECTWEKADDLPPSAQPAIVEYQARENRTTLPYNSAHYPRGGRPAYSKITEVPEYLQQSGGTLKEFQLTGLNWLAYTWSNEENGILADEVS